jgi:RNA polymerase sigma factor, sigma-70 family
VSLSPWCLGAQQKGMVIFMDDSFIIELYWSRNESAISETAAKYGPFCYGIAWNILFCKEDSEECVNDTYMQTWNSIPPQRPQYFRAFVGRITRNLAINRYNFLNREKRGGSVVTVALDELRECIIPGNNVEAYVENTLLGESIGAFLSNVTQLERIVFVRRYWFLDSIHEISTQCNLTETNVSTILHRLRKKLKSHLRKTGFMP